MNYQDFEQPKHNLSERQGDVRIQLLGLLLKMPEILKHITGSNAPEVQVKPAWVRGAREMQAQAFLRGVLMPLVAKEALTEEKLRGAVIEWRRTHQGQEGGENLVLGWVEGEAHLLAIQNVLERKAGWYVEGACLLKKTLDQLAEIDIPAIDYELETGKPLPLED